jgi:hypothetical protein
MNIRYENITVAEQKQTRAAVPPTETSKSGYTLEECIVYVADTLSEHIEDGISRSLLYYLRDYAKLRAKGVNNETQKEKKNGTA